MEGQCSLEIQPSLDTMKIRLVVYNDPLNKDRHGLFDDDVVMELKRDSVMSDVFARACVLAEVTEDSYTTHSSFSYDDSWTLDHWVDVNDKMRSFLYDYMMTFEIVPI